MTREDLAGWCDGVGGPKMELQYRSAPYQWRAAQPRATIGQSSGSLIQPWRMA